MKSWINTIRDKIDELEHIIEWASLVNYGKVRDLCRSAQYELKEEIKRQETIKEKVSK